MRAHYLTLLGALLGVACSLAASADQTAEKPSAYAGNRPTLTPLASPQDFVFKSAPSTLENLSPAQTKKIEPGVLLVATERVRNDILRGAVILVVRHLTSGTRGIVINRPTPLVFGEIRVQVAGEPGDNARVHYGGPVDARQVRYLLHGPRSHATEARVATNVWFGTREDTLDAAARHISGQHLRLFAGHVHWGTDELQAQVERGDWLLAPATTATLFARDTHGLWERLLNGVRDNDLVQLIHAW